MKPPLEAVRRTSALCFLRPIQRSMSVKIALLLALTLGRRICDLLCRFTTAECWHLSGTTLKAVLHGHEYSKIMQVADGNVHFNFQMRRKEGEVGLLVSPACICMLWAMRRFMQELFVWYRVTLLMV